MSNNLIPVDISKMPDLVRLVEDMKHTKEPRVLKQGSAPVALLTPIQENTEKWQKIKVAFGSWGDRDPDDVVATIHHWRKEGSRPATRPA